MSISTINNLNDYLNLDDNTFENFDILLGDNLRMNYGDFKNSDDYYTYFDYHGRPKENITKKQVDNSFIKDMNIIFRERRNITENIIDDLRQRNSNIDTTDFDKDFMTDFYINDNTTQMEISFVNEGAGYKNVFGYYFYRLQETKSENGENNIKPIILTGGKYTPTIMFPNASKKNNGGTLLIGDTRTVLLGDSVDIENVNVGFFLIPNGWDSWRRIVRYNYKPIIHSTPRFNHNWNIELEGTDKNSFLDNDGYQSLLTKYDVESNENIYSFCFEDISRPGGDKDFNDLCMLIKIERKDNSEPPTIAPTYEEPTDETTKTETEITKQSTQLENTELTESSMLEYTDEGMFIQILNTEFTPEINKCYEIIYKFTIKNQELYDIFKPALSELIFIEDEGVVDKTTYNFNDETLQIELKHIFSFVSQEEINNSIKDFKSCLQIKVFDILPNYDEELPTQELLDVQHVLMNDENVFDESIILKECDNEIELLNVPKGPDIISRSLLLWGDPHIITIYGKGYKMDDLEGVFNLFKNDNLSIRGEFWKIEKLREHDKLHDKTFMKKISIQFMNENIGVIIDISNYSAKFVDVSTHKEIDINMDSNINELMIIFNKKIKNVDIYKKIKTRSIRIEYKEFYLELFDTSEIDDLQNFIEANTKYLLNCSYLSKAHGVWINNKEENYEKYDTFMIC
jgi:hypothetical protein